LTDERQAPSFESRLAHVLGGALHSVVLTDNRSRIVSSRPRDGALEVRIHRSFALAPKKTLIAVGKFLGGARGAARRRALDAIREHFERHQGEPRPRRVKLRSKGRHFDLIEVLSEVNHRFFKGELELTITWGRTPVRRRRGRGISLRLGSYHHDQRLIRIHRALDGSEVPRYVVESVIYHEMLHAVMPPTRPNGGRRRIHPPEFRRRERQFPDYERAERWITENLPRLAGKK
jgi:hypothetical protein